MFKPTDEGQKLIQAELCRIGTGLSAMESHRGGLMTIADEAGRYVLTATCLEQAIKQLKEFSDRCIVDQSYDGDEAHIWSELFALTDPHENQDYFSELMGSFEPICEIFTSYDLNFDDEDEGRLDRAVTGADMREEI
jgi:hypothetical protein